VRLSLPYRIFLVHVAFAVAAAALAAFLVWDSFQRYKARWEEELETLPAEELFQPFAKEVARSLLLRLEEDAPEEVRDEVRSRISAALDILLRGLPGVRAVVIADRERRIQYASDAQVIDQAYARPDYLSLLASIDTVRREVFDDDGRPVTRLMIPVFDEPSAGDADAVRRRLGSMIVMYSPDPSLIDRVKALRPPSIPTRSFALPVVLFLGTVAVSGILLAVLTGLPVRRLDRALRDFRARDFRGRLDIDRRELKGQFAEAISAINELGGRLQALDAQGREREALLATLAQSLEEGMIALAPDGEPLAWNPAALRILVADGDELGEHADADLERACLGSTLERNPDLLTVPAADGPGPRREIDLRLADGERSPVQVTLVPFEIAPGQIGRLVLLRDVATLQKVERHLLEAGRYAGLAHLAAGLAHEIRNPLHAIGLNAEVVQQYVGPEVSDSRQRAMTESLDAIKSETRRLTDLLNNYLGLVRPERHLGPVDVRELCRRVRQLLAHSATESNVEIHLAGEPVPPVEGVASRLQQAILNLVLNSIQAMPEGGKVTLETAVRQGRVEVTVADTGPGVPPERRAQMFEVRMTTKPEGSGLGLPLVRLIAEAHGGEIEYRPGGEGGSVMILRLPLRAAA